MRDLFNLDSPLMRFLGRMGDLMILNILFLVTSVPLVTVGASLTAMHYVTLRMVSGNEGAVSKDYFRSFRQNFKEATAIWLILLAFAFLLQYDLRAVWSGTGYINTAVKALSIVACAALVMVLLYVFAVLARFDNTVRGTLKNSVALALRFFPRTVSMFMLVFACVILTLYTQATLKWGILAWLIMGFSAITYFNSFMLKKIFDRLTGPAPEDGESGEDSEDEKNKK